MPPFNQKNTSLICNVDPQGDVSLVPTGTFQARVFDVHPAFIRVSTDRLRRASSLFHELIYNSFLADDELRLPSEGRTSVFLPPDHDPEALLILMRILHGQTQDVPQEVNLYVLRDIAFLVDTYKLQSLDSVCALVPRWVEQASHDSDQRDIHGKLAAANAMAQIAWCFNFPRVFEAATRVLIVDTHPGSTDLVVPSESAGRPLLGCARRSIHKMQTRCVTKINQYRQELLEKMCDVVREARNTQLEDGATNTSDVVYSGRSRMRIGNEPRHERIAACLDSIVRRASTTPGACSPATFRAEVERTREYVGQYPVHSRLRNRKNRDASNQGCEDIVQSMLDRLDELLKGTHGLTLSLYRGYQPPAVPQGVEVRFRRFQWLFGGN